MNLLGVLEGLLFAVGDEGLTLEQVSEILEIDIEEAKEILKNLKSTYEEDNRGVRISYLGNAFKLTTKKEHKDYYQKLIESPYTNTLSQAALETLAIIAYNEPITRLVVDEIRGVSSSQLLRKLSAKGFIKECGRSEIPGRPILYKTTNEFLDYFGLSSLTDLPKINLEEENIVDAEVDLFKSKYQEVEEN